MQKITFNLLLVLSILLCGAAHGEEVDQLVPIEVEQLPFKFSLEQWLICESIERLGAGGQCQKADLESLNFSKDRPVTLIANILLDSSLADQELALVGRGFKGADALFIDQTLIEQTGRLQPTYSDASDYPRYYPIGLTNVSFNQPNLLMLKLYNPNGYGHLNNMNITLVNRTDMQYQLLVHEALLAAIAGMLIVIALLTAHYYFRIAGSYETLALAACCGFAALFTILHSTQLLQAGYDANSLLRFKGVFFGFSQFCLGYYLLFAVRLKNLLVNRIVLSFFLCSGTFQLIWPSVELLPLFYFLTQAFALLVCVALLAFGLLESFNSGESSRPYLLIGIALFAVTLVLQLSNNDFLSQRSSGEVLPVGLLIIGVVGGWWTTDHYWKYFKGSTHDHLTGTLLKGHFVSRLTEEMYRAQRGQTRLLVAVMDIDQFKLINQNYGHDGGDRTLMLAAATLKSNLREFDLICRLTDDEFCIAVNLPVNEKSAQDFVQRLHHQLNHTNVTLEQNVSINLQVTTGAVIYDADRHQVPEALVHDAEHAVTDAKMKQRGALQWFDTENPPIDFIL